MTNEPRELRPYQTAAVAAVEREWQAGNRRTAVVLPTGSGKSTVIGKLTANAYHKGEPTLVVAHRAELLHQMRENLLAVDPAISPRHTGIVMADQDDHSAPIVYASLQTLASAKRRNSLGVRSKLFWDEVHHAAADGFHASMADMGMYDRSLMAGFTATLFRNDKKGVGLGDIIQTVAYEKDLPWAIRHGFLVQPRGLTVRIKGLDALNDVRTVAGDFKQDELAEVMEAAVEYVVDAIKMHAADRTNIIFAASVDGAHMIAEAMTEAGMPAAAVTGAMKHDEREVVYNDFRTGAVKNMVTVMVLTEGADFPMCDCVVMARPTKSKNLYAQMVGRALRLYPGKTDALVLDLSGSTRQMRLVNLTDLDKGAPTAEVDEDGTALKICPDCDLYVNECICLPDEGSGGPSLKVVRQGPVDLVSIDLLSSSKTLWLETPGGVPFIAGTEGWTVFLWPLDGVPGADLWRPGLTNTKRPMDALPLELKGQVAEYMPLDDAADFAEAWAYMAQDKFQFNDKAASWRKNQPPSEAQVRFAHNLGIVGADQMTKARLSDEISVAVAARILDEHMEAPRA